MKRFNIRRTIVRNLSHTNHYNISIFNMYKLIGFVLAVGKVSYMYIRFQLLRIFANKDIIVKFRK